MRKKFKFLVMIAVMTLICLGLGDIRSVMAKGKVQDKAYASATVAAIQQEQSNWCWAACSSAVLQHYGINASQEDIVNYIKGGLYNQTATTGEMLRAVRENGLSASFRGVPTYDQIQSEIDTGNPMETLIGWTNGGGHALVLDGYFLNQGRQYINIMDPWYGDHFNYNYQYYRSNENFKWNAIIGYFGR